MRPTLAVLAAVMAAMLAAGCSRDDSPKPAPEPARAAGPTKVLFGFERFKSAPLVDGGELDLASLRGKVVLLDYFGTWCPPCRKSTPVLISLYERFRDQGLEVVGLAFERTPDAQQARDGVAVFREQFMIPYILTIGPDAAWDELRERTGLDQAVPTLLLVDRQQNVRYVFQGMEPGEEAVMADLVEELLAEGGAAPTAPK
jgi:thiol-disulfide isomerase/thioredoxin